MYNSEVLKTHDIKACSLTWKYINDIYIDIILKYINDIFHSVKRSMILFF